MPRIIDPAKSDNPGPPRLFLISGARTITPINPYTTEGIAARSSIVGFIILITDRGTYSLRKKATDTPSGAPIIIAPKVTHSDAVIIGKIPYFPNCGCHSFAKRKFFNPYLNIKGSPSLKIKRAISSNADIAENAAAINNLFTVFSPTNFI